MEPSYETSIIVEAFRSIRTAIGIWPVLLSWLIGYNSPTVVAWCISNLLPTRRLALAGACVLVVGVFTALRSTFFVKKTQPKEREETHTYVLRWESQTSEADDDRFKDICPFMDFDLLDAEMEAKLNAQEISRENFQNELNEYSESIRGSFEHALHSESLQLANNDTIAMDLASEMGPYDLVGRWVFVQSHGRGRVIAFNRSYLPGSGSSRHVIDFDGEHRHVVLRRTKFLVLMNRGCPFELIDPPEMSLGSSTSTESEEKIESSAHASLEKSGIQEAPKTVQSSLQDNLVQEVQQNLAPVHTEGCTLQVNTAPGIRDEILCTSEFVALTSFDKMRQEKVLPLLRDFRERILGSSQNLSSLQREFLSDETLLRYLRASDGNPTQAESNLNATLKWRAQTVDPVLEAYRFDPATGKSISIKEAASKLRCPACVQDASSHCFFRLGKDVSGRQVVYSCAGRSKDKDVEKNVAHMWHEMERIFGGGADPGTMVWIIDFNGFGLCDCSPRMGALSIPMFVKHYPERLGEVLLLDPPYLFFGLYKTVLPLVDQVTRKKIKFLKGLKAQEVYSGVNWEASDKHMATWMRAVKRIPGKPGNYPHKLLTEALSDDVSRETILRN